MKFTISASYTDQAKKIRKYLKDNHKNWKFSVLSSRFGVNIHIMESPVEIFNFDENKPGWATAREALYASGKLALTESFIPKKHLTDKAFNELTAIREALLEITEVDFYMMIGKSEKEPLVITGEKI